MIGIRMGARALGGEKRSDEPTKVSVTARPPDPDPEIVAKPAHRTFTAEYKLRILEETDRCSEPGEVGRILCREGPYSSCLRVGKECVPDFDHVNHAGESGGPQRRWAVDSRAEIRRYLPSYQDEALMTRGFSGPSRLEPRATGCHYAEQLDVPFIFRSNGEAVWSLNRRDRLPCPEDRGLLFAGRLGTTDRGAQDPPRHLHRRHRLGRSSTTTTRSRALKRYLPRSRADAASFWSRWQGGPTGGPINS